MRRIIPFALFIVLLLAGCVQVAAYPAITVLEHGLAKGIIYGNNYVPVDKTADFTQDDTYVYSYLSAAFYSANLTWKWYDPSGALYSSTSRDSECITTPCWFSESLQIADSPAAVRFGVWRMELLADGYPLYLDRFTIRPVITEDRSWFFELYDPPIIARVNLAVRIHPQSTTSSNYHITFSIPNTTDITAYEANTNRSLAINGKAGDMTVDFGDAKSDGYEFRLIFNMGLRSSSGNSFNLTWSQQNGIHPVPQRFLITLPVNSGLGGVMGPVGVRVLNASRTSVIFNQTLSPNQLFTFSVTYFMQQKPSTKVTILPIDTQGGGSIFALQVPLIPLTVGDISLWSAVMAIILLVTSELVSPYYGRTGLVIDRRRLRLAALLVAFIFLAIVVFRVFQLVLVT